MRLAALVTALLAGACSSTLEIEPPTARPGSTPTESRALFDQGNALLREGDLAAALGTFHESIDTAVREHDESTVVQALSQIARVHALRGDIERAATWLQEAELRATPEDPDGWARYLFAEAMWLRALERPEPARERLENLFGFAMDEELHEVSLEAAYELTLDGAPDERIEWSRRAIELAETLDDGRWLAVLWNNLGWTLGTAERRGEALDALLRAQSYHVSSESSDLQLLSAHYAVGHAYRMIGDREKAGVWLTESLRWARDRYASDPSPLNAEWVGLCYLEVAELAAEAGELIDAIRGFELAQQYLLAGGAEERLPTGLQKLEDRLQELRALAYP